MDEMVQRQWVWWSDEASRAAGKMSVLAVAETLICVAVYWILLVRYGITWHHWLILIAAPLVLLRSDASMADGVRWFEACYNSFATDIAAWSPRNAIAEGLTGAGSFLMTLALARGF